jgi:8-oxo-dGTP pyrophosphatase MutT (NUDIX family)
MAFNAWWRGFCGMVEVALAMVEKDGQWLLQLRDDLDWIAAPGCWGLFGGHLEPGESPEVALRRELLEEISWRAESLRYRFAHRNAERMLHFFSTTLLAPLDSLCLREGQDMVLATADALRQGSIWSPALREFRPLAPSLQLAVAHLNASL